MLTIIILKLFLILPFPKGKSNSESNIVIYRVSRVKKGRNRAETDIKGVVTIGIPLPRKKSWNVYIYMQCTYIYIYKQ